MEYNGIYRSLNSIDHTEGVLRPSLEATYGPYDSTDAAWNEITATFSPSEIPIGLTVGIMTGNTIKEYWFNGGTGKSNLVEKLTGGGSVSLETIPTDIINNIFNSK